MKSDRKYDAILFDLDGTLIDSAPDVHACVNDMLAELERPSISLSNVKDLIGGGARPLVFGALELTGGAESDDNVDIGVQKFMEIYRNNPARYAELFPGVIETLHKLQDDGFQMGICTNKPMATAMPVLDYFELHGFFPVVSCGDQVPHQKPDPRHVRHAMELIESSASNTLFVGDSLNDVIASKRADVDVLAVSYGYEEVALMEEDATMIINHISEIINFVGR